MIILGKQKKLTKNVFVRCCQWYEKMTVNEPTDFIYENCCKWFGFNKESTYYSFVSSKINKKIPDPNNTQEYHQYYLNKKNIKKTGETIKNM